jgi:hypothetical protein
MYQFWGCKTPFEEKNAFLLQIILKKNRNRDVWLANLVEISI